MELLHQFKDLEIIVKAIISKLFKSIDIRSKFFYTKISGHSSVVERNLAKVDVARSNRVARFKLLNSL